MMICPNGTICYAQKNENLFIDQYIESVIRYTFPFNDLLEQKDTSNSVDTSDYVRKQRVAVYPYLRKYLEYALDESEIGDIAFKRIVEAFNKYSYESLGSEIDRLKTFSETSVFGKLLDYQPSLNDLGRVNTIKLICDSNSIDFSSLDMVSTGRRQYIIELLKEVDDIQKVILAIIDLLTDNKVHINFLATLLHVCINGYSDNDDAEVLLSNVDESRQLVEKFTNKVSQYPPGSLFLDSDFDKNKNFQLFNLWLSHGNPEELTKKISDYLATKDEGYLNFMESLMYKEEAHFRDGNGYSSGIKDEVFRNIERFIGRTLLLKYIYADQPDMKDTDPKIHKHGLRYEPAKRSIAIQYIKYTNHAKDDVLAEKIEA